MLLTVRRILATESETKMAWASFNGLGKRLDDWLFDQKAEYSLNVDVESEDGWMEAAESRMKPRTREQIIAAIEKKNHYRFWRLRHDYKWLQKKMRKMGYNPDEAKDLL